jgi:hypothetical protein
VKQLIDKATDRMPGMENKSDGIDPSRRFPLKSICCKDINSGCQKRLVISPSRLLF